MLQETMMSGQELEQAISGFMLELGIPAHLRGYQYLRSAVEMCTKDMELVGSVTKLLYPDLARMYKMQQFVLNYFVSDTPKHGQIRRSNGRSEMRSRCPGREGTAHCLRSCSDTAIPKSTAGLQTVSISQPQLTIYVSSTD